MAFPFFRLFSRHRAHHKAMSQLTKDDKAIDSGTLAALKREYQSRLADKYLGMVARSANMTVKVKGTFNTRNANSVITTMARAERTMARANVNRARAKNTADDAAKGRTFAVGAAAGVLSAGVGSLV